MVEKTLAERLEQLKEPATAEPEEPSDEIPEIIIEEIDDIEERLGAITPEAAPKSRTRLMSWLLGTERQTTGKGVVTKIPAFDARRWQEFDFYPVEPPYSFARILRDRVSGELRYEAIEPTLTEDDRQILAFVQDALVRGLSINPAKLDMELRQEYLKEAVRRVLRDYRIRVDTVTEERLDYYVRRNFLGYDRINVLMRDPNVEDISCDGAREGIFVFHREHESLQTTIMFEDDASLDSFVVRMAQGSGKAISISEPMLDAALTDGSRLQATLGHEVTQNGSTFTIRRFRPDPFTPLDLVQFGTMDVPMLAWFWLVVEHGHSLIMAGGTASGKTTSLNAIGQFMPPQAKVVTIEDTREVNLPHKNWIKAVTRAGSRAEGAGEIGMFELLKAALRQRPEYILVGEVRGVEATVAFQAMATGHTVYSTMHADSARSVVYRLENDPINIPRLVLQALDIIAIQGQVRIGQQRVRRIMEVVELVGLDPQTKELLTNSVFKWNPRADEFTFNGRSFMMESIGASTSRGPAEMRKELQRRQTVLQWMIDQKISSVQGLTDIVKAYYMDPEQVMERIGSLE